LPAAGGHAILERMRTTAKSVVWSIVQVGAVAVSLATSSSGQQPELVRYSRSELHMGVEFEVALYAPDSAMAERAIAKAMTRIAELDKSMSDYDPESELSKLSETSAASGSRTAAPFPAVKLGDDLWRVLSASQAISRASDGAFDVTVGPLTKLWRRARRWKELPEADAVAAARAAVGYRSLELDSEAHTARLLQPNMRLDLGGIAKGYAADEAVKTVVDCGITRVLVRASGDITAADPPPGERGWKVGVAPLNPDDPPTRFVEIAHRGISTSGDARQHLVVDGRRYSHIIDPRSGEPVGGRSSVTVIAPRGTLADGLATAASVLGPERAVELVKKFEGVELLMVYEDEEGKQRAVESPGFKKFETETE
jgi:FAD:protein FMN transferase